MIFNVFVGLSRRQIANVLCIFCKCSVTTLEKCPVIQCSIRISVTRLDDFEPFGYYIKDVGNISKTRTNILKIWAFFKDICY